MLKQIFILIIITIAPIYSGANIYRYLDSNGNYVFTDRTKPKATQIQIKQQQSFTWRSIPSPTTATQNPQIQKTEYSLTITTPKQNQYIRNIEKQLGQGKLEVIARLSPELKNGQIIQAYLDNQPYGEPQITTTFRLANINRGNHELQLELIDQKSGQKLAYSNLVKFYMHRNIAKKISPISN